MVTIEPPLGISLAARRAAVIKRYATGDIRRPRSTMCATDSIAGTSTSPPTTVPNAAPDWNLDSATAAVKNQTLASQASTGAAGAADAAAEHRRVGAQLLR